MPGPEENGIGFINAWNRHRSGARPALNWPGPMYVCMHIYIYIYMYIERERERERETYTYTSAPLENASGPRLDSYDYQ